MSHLTTTILDCGNLKIGCHSMQIFVLHGFPFLMRHVAMLVKVVTIVLIVLINCPSDTFISRREA